MKEKVVFDNDEIKIEHMGEKYCFRTTLKCGNYIIETRLLEEDIEVKVDGQKLSLHEDGTLWETKGRADGWMYALPHRVAYNELAFVVDECIGRNQIVFECDGYGGGYKVEINKICVFSEWENRLGEDKEVAVNSTACAY